jgi:hypothetical protein
VYKIENRNSGLVLDDVDGQTDAPAPIKQYGSWNDDGRQQWKLIRVVTNTPAPPAATPPAATPPAATPPAATPPAATPPAAPRTIIDLNGSWLSQGLRNQPVLIISVSSTSITIDMSRHGQQTAYGSIVDSSTISVTFQGGNVITGRLELPNVIRWSSGHFWTKP